MKVYDVWTDADEAGVTEIAVAIAKKWIAFAMGEDQINGMHIANPTGRMASSISIEKISPLHIAIVSDEEMAPESKFLEEGHARYDMKSKFLGRVFPLHRGTGEPILNSTFGGRANNVWASPRAEGFNGMARVPTHITPENEASWIIPAMPAWSPVMHLVALAQRGVNMMF